MFELTKGEFVDLRSQIVTSSSPQWGGPRYRPMAFTEQGVAMLSSVLRSKPRYTGMKNLERMNEWFRRAKSNLVRAKAGKLSPEILYECGEEGHMYGRALDNAFPETESLNL